MNIPLVFQNEFFLALDKPAGVLSVPGRQGRSDPRPDLVKLLSGMMIAEVRPVHRLDQAVTGILLYATREDAHRVANGWFAKRRIGKRYEALTEGAPSSSQRQGEIRRWETRILRGKKRAYESPAGKPAVTEACWLGTVTAGGCALQHWSLTPLTGRPHQLRFELARRGFPVWGDALYGAAGAFPVAEAIALRAVSLDFSACAEAAGFGLPHRLEVLPLLSCLTAPPSRFPPVCSPG